MSLEITPDTRLFKERLDQVKLEITRSCVANCGICALKGSDWVHLESDKLPTSERIKVLDEAQRKLGEVGKTVELWVDWQLGETDFENDLASNEEILTFLQGAQHIRSWDFRMANWDPRFAPLFLESLKENQYIREFHFNRVLSSLSKEEVTQLCEALRSPNCGISTLSISTDMQTSDNTASEIGKLLAEPVCKLEALRLEDGTLGSQGAKALALGLLSNRTLKQLSLAHNHIGSEGVRELCRVVETDGNVLEELDLSKNRWERAGWQSIGQALQTDSCALRTLALTPDHVGGETVDELSSRVQEDGWASYACRFFLLGDLLRVGMGLLNGYLSFQPFCQGIAKNSSLRELKLNGGRLDLGFCSKLLQALEDNKHLEKVELASCKLDDTDGARVLSFLKDQRCTLKSLDLSGNEFSRQMKADLKTVAEQREDFDLQI